jgi:hypothetical protein
VDKNLAADKALLAGVHHPATAVVMRRAQHPVLGGAGQSIPEACLRLHALVVDDTASDAGAPGRRRTVIASIR